MTGGRVRRERVLGLLGCLAAFVAATPALAQWRARLVARAPGAVAWTTGPVQVRVGDAVEVALWLTGPDGRRYADPDVRLVRRGAAVSPQEALPAGVRVSWERVESRLLHVEHDPPNPGNPSFSNNVLFGPRHGAWLGYDRLEYATYPALPRRGTRAEGASRLVVAAAHPARRDLDRHGGAGSLWLAAEVTLPDGATVHTPGAHDTDRLGLSRDVLRVSFREGDGFLGWLSTFFNVPNVFGSNGPTDVNHQTERYTGADCADVLVGALRASGRRDVRYVSVAGIGRYARAVSPPLVMTAGRGVRTTRGEERVLRWGQDVEPGDLLAIDYLDAGRTLPRAWDHIGALVEDGGPAGAPDGVLGPEDVLRHVTGRGLDDRPLGQELPIGLRLWRWRGDVPARVAARVLARPVSPPPSGG